MAKEKKVARSKIIKKKETKFPAEQKKANQEDKALPPSWPKFVTSKDTTNQEIQNRLRVELKTICSEHSKHLQNYIVLYLYDNEFSISSYSSDKIFTALNKLNNTRDKNVLLVISSNGGSIEPAYQISKSCHIFSKEKFVVVVPRLAKSAATLISLGANEIHMGMLSQLGPIDPQVNGKSVLGLKYSLEQIAKICSKYPKSSDMFSKYLAESLFVHNIGHYERIGVSAVQYAERLISNKTYLQARANEIAEALVYEYKDHGFVIDIDEAKQKIDNKLIKTETSEMVFAEEIHQKIDWVNLCLSVLKDKYVRIIGELDSGILVSDKSDK